MPSSSSPDDRHGLTVPDAYTIALGDPVPHHRQCAVAVWQRFNGANGIVQRAVRRVGGDWQASVDLSVANQDSGRARVAVDARGNAIAVWQHRNDVYDAHWIVTRAVRRVRGEWQAPVDLTAPGQCAAAPEVAVDARGNAVAVWESWYWLSGVNSIVQGAVRRVGEAWQAPVDFSRADRHASGRRSLSMRASTRWRSGSP